MSSQGVMNMMCRSTAMIWMEMRMTMIDCRPARTIPIVMTLTTLTMTALMFVSRLLKQMRMTMIAMKMKPILIKAMMRRAEMNMLLQMRRKIQLSYAETERSMMVKNVMTGIRFQETDVHTVVKPKNVANDRVVHVGEHEILSARSNSVVRDCGENISDELAKRCFATIMI